MSQLAAMLREHYERSTYKSVAALARAAQTHSPLSESYLKHLVRGERDNPSYDKLMAIARALNLSHEETNRLLEAAGLPALIPENGNAEDPQMQQVLDALTQLRHTPGLPAAALQAVVNGFLLLVEGARAFAGVGAKGSAGVEGHASRGAGAQRSMRALAQNLGPEESLVDDLLGEILSRSGDHPLDTLFLFLEEAAGEKGWEIKRRIAEALPQLVELQPEATLRLAAVLRADYHPDYRADIRRRVVEAVPALYRYGPKEALELLSFREQDDTFTGIAIVEALHDLEGAGLITAVASDRYFNALRLDKSDHEEVIRYLRRLLHETREKPAAALLSMQAARDHADRLFKICVLRTAPRLLRSHPRQVLELMAYFLRRNADGVPAEHQNVRRPVVKALPEMAALLAEAAPAVREQADQLVQVLAQDPDIHIRRAVGDALSRLVAVSPEMVMGTLDMLVRDPDPYVRQRAGRAVLKLADQYPEQARDYYVALLTAVG